MSEKEITPDGAINATDAELALNVSSLSSMVPKGGLIQLFQCNDSDPDLQARNKALIWKQGISHAHLFACSARDVHGTYMRV